MGLGDCGKVVLVDSVALGCDLGPVWVTGAPDDPDAHLRIPNLRLGLRWLREMLPWVVCGETCKS